MTLSNRLCFSTLTCPAWTLEQIVEAAVANELHGIDFRGIGEQIDITRLEEFNARLPDTLALLERNRLSMPCLNTSVTLVTPAPERWDMMLEEFRRSAELAAKTGTVMLRVFGGAVPKDLSREQARQLAQRHLRQLTKMGRPFDCIPVLETHDSWATSDEVLELIHEMPPVDVGVLWDIEHPYRKGESPADTVQVLSRYIRHVHVKDSVRVDGRNEPKLMGNGDLPLTLCAAELRRTGYEGWLSLECEKRWRAGAPEPEESLPHFGRFMRQAWASVSL